MLLFVDYHHPTVHEVSYRVICQLPQSPLIWTGSCWIGICWSKTLIQVINGLCFFGEKRFNLDSLMILIHKWWWYKWYWNSSTDTRQYNFQNMAVAINKLKSDSMSQLIMVSSKNNSHYYLDILSNFNIPCINEMYIFDEITRQVNVTFWLIEVKSVLVISLRLQHKTICRSWSSYDSKGYNVNK